MRLHFSLDKRPFCGLDAGLFPAFGLRWAHLSCQRSSPFVDIEHGQRDNSPVTCDVQIETSLEHGITHFLQLVIKQQRENVGTLLMQHESRINLAGSIVAGG